jgi:hypothetical protein
MGFKYNPKPAGYIGFFHNSRLRDHVNLRSEFAICTRGAYYDFDGDILWFHLIDTGTYNFVYLNIPVTVLYHIEAPGRTHGIYLGAGPAVGLPIYAHLTSDNGEDANIYDDMKTLVFGYQLVGGFDFGKRFIELRYDRQLSHFMTDEGKEYNMSLLFLVGTKL